MGVVFEQKSGATPGSPTSLIYKSIHKFSYLSEDTLYLVLDVDGKGEEKDVSGVLIDDPDNVKFKRRDNGWILNIVPKPASPGPCKALPGHNVTDDEKSEDSEGTRSSDFVINSMGFFTKKYFAIQENIDTGKQRIHEVQEALSPSFLKNVSFAQMYENLDSPTLTKTIYDIHDQYSPNFLKKVTFSFPNV